MSYGVEISELRRSSMAAEQAASELRPVNLAGAVEGINAAMPGSVSENRADALATSWGLRLGACVLQLAERAERLSAAAETYRDDDGAATDDFGGMARPH